MRYEKHKAEQILIGALYILNPLLIHMALCPIVFIPRAVLLSSALYHAVAFADGGVALLG